MLSGLTLFQWIALVVVAVLLLVVGIFLFIGLFQARSLVRREFSAYFLSPIAYVVLVVFLLATGVLFSMTLYELNATGPKGIEYPMRFMLGQWWFWLVFLVIPPVLSMRLFAEERSTGTLEVLMTAPLRDWQVVLSKYVACFAFYVVMWLPTVAYLPILLDLRWPMKLNTTVEPHQWEFALLSYGMLLVAGVAGAVAMTISASLPIGRVLRGLALVLLLASLVGIGVGWYGHENWDPKSEHFQRLVIGNDPMPVLASYLGLALAGAMFLAIGLLVSSLVRSQLVSFLVSLALSMLFIVAGPWLPEIDRGSPLYQMVFFFSVPLHFDRDFTQGLVDTRHLVLYGSVAVFCLFLTVRSVESRRWR